MSGEIQRGFLDYIVANIDEDTPRLAYADWLEENGQSERAEFIRVQVERANLPAWDPAQIPLRLREEKLLKEQGEAWLAELPAIEGVRWEGFRRGIVAEVSFASYEAMRANAHACRAVAPIEAVTVRWPRRREAQKSAPPIAELRELLLTGRPDDPNMVTRLAASPQLATLRVLTARGLWAQGLVPLVSSPHLAKLKSFRLPANTLGNDGIYALIRSAALTSLEELDLSGRGISERYNDDPIIRSPGMESLANWPGFATVRSLNLNGNEFGQVGLRSLLRSPHARGLKELSIRATRLDGRAMAEFDTVTPGLKLESLDVGENLLKDLGAEYLAIVPCLKELRSLRMDLCEVSGVGGRVFAKKASFLDKLCSLDVSHNHFGRDGLAALLERKSPTLHTLRMRHNNLFDEGAELFATSPATGMLREVDFSYNEFGLAAIRALIKCKHLGQLQILRLNYNKFSEESSESLRTSQLGQRLALLEMTDGIDIPF
jgi:uncharacterized protein (TIGR02996 family)